MSEPVGIIYPPPDLRGIVDSTAKYVAKNGGAFEEKIKREHRDKPKFSFLLTGDPFNAYYQYKVKEIRNQLLGGLESRQQSQDSSQPVAGQISQPSTYNEDSSEVERRPDESPEGPHQPPPPNQNKSTTQLASDQETNGDLSTQSPNNQVALSEGPSVAPEDDVSYGDGAPRVRLKLNEYIQEKSIKLEEPPPLNYLATPASLLSQLECDVIKLTSQFIATYGRTFLLELVSREQNNSQFYFLKPQHGQFSYMTNLIMQYALIQNHPLDVLEQLNKDATNRKHVLDRIKMRAEWTRMLEAEQKKREEAEEKEKLLYSQIDWHDFVIVETIDYQPEERGEYPPTTADQVGTRLLLQQGLEEQNVPEEMEIDMDVESEDEDSKGAGEGESNDGFAVPDLLPPETLIRRDYDPKMKSKTVQQPNNYFVSPITNERIPADKIHEHMRYNLSDPRYLEKKGQMLQERMNEETVFASGSQIQDSLKNLAERRTDIFGMNDEETVIGKRIDENEQEQPKNNRLIWDGHKSSLKKKKLG